MKTMKDLEYIDSYFKGELPPDEISRFEQKITGDTDFANDVAFYIAGNEVALQELTNEKKARFRELYRKQQKGDTKRPVRKIWSYVAAAAVISGVVIAVEFLFVHDSAQKMADRYVDKELSTMGVNMSSRQDSIQAGLQLYNDKKWAEALATFANIIRTDPGAWEAINYAGIASLRLQEFDKALSYFKQLQTYPLNSNPAKFLEALTYMERNQAGDLPKAKQLLTEVVQNNLYGKETARKWLDQWPG